MRPLSGACIFGAQGFQELLMNRAARSAIMIVGAFVLPLTIVGITEASATRNPTMPWTLRSGPRSLQRNFLPDRDRSWEHRTSRERRAVHRAAGNLAATPAVCSLHEALG